MMPGGIRKGVGSPDPLPVTHGIAACIDTDLAMVETALQRAVLTEEPDSFGRGIGCIDPTGQGEF